MARTPALDPKILDEGRTDDLVQPFQIDRFELRGRLVRLGDSVDAVLRRHDYPVPVARLLGEAMALAACLASSLKYEGVFTLQARGDGPIRLLVADVTSEGHLRGYVGYDSEGVNNALSADEAPTVPRLFGGGHLAFTVDQGPDTQRYQGIVELEGATLADCIHHYFRQSEQIETVVKAASDAAGKSGAWRASALMIQRLPEQRNDPEQTEPVIGTASEEGWHRALVFMGSATSREMLNPDLGPRSLLYRLFHEDGVRVFDPRFLEERCRCGTRERIESVIGSLDRGQVEDLKVDDEVTVTCEFCRRTERFTDADLVRIFGS